MLFVISECNCSLWLSYMWITFPGLGRPMRCLSQKLCDNHRPEAKHSLEIQTSLVFWSCCIVLLLTSPSSSTSSSLVVLVPTCYFYQLWRSKIPGSVFPCELKCSGVSASGGLHARHRNRLLIKWAGSRRQTHCHENPGRFRLSLKPS